MEAIKTAALTKRYRHALAVDRLSLTVFPGELFSLPGGGGAGKTTTIKMLCGLTAPTGGNAWLLGDSIVGYPSAPKKAGPLPAGDRCGPRPDGGRISADDGLYLRRRHRTGRLGADHARRYPSPHT